MSKQIIGNYTFSTSAKTVTLTDFATIRLDRLRLITDVTTNEVLYNFADSSVSTATVATNVITLSALQGGETNTDKLEIDYDTITGDPTYDTPPLSNNAAKETGGNLALIVTNTTGAATATNQATANTSLSTIATNTGNIPAKGSATKANSTPVNIASDQTVPIQGTFSEQAALSASSLNADLVPSTDATGYKSFSLQIISLATGGGLTVQGSNDNTTWYTVQTQNAVGTTSPPNNGIGSVTLQVGSVSHRYIRVRQTSWTSGTTTGTFELFTSPAVINVIGAVGASQNGTWTVGSNSATSAAVPANAFFVGVQGASNNLQSMRSVGNAGTSASGTDFWTAVGAGVYNGATMDSLRGNWNTSTGDTGAKTASFAGATQTNYNHKFAYITVLCGTVSGTTPTLNAQLQWSPDAGTTWINIGAASSNVTATGNTITFVVGPTNVTTGGATPAALTFGSTAQVLLNTPLPRTWRLNYTIGGTTPSFAITGVYVNYQGV